LTFSPVDITPFIAVITSAFARVRAVSAVSAFTAKKKGYPVLRDADNEGVVGDDEAMWMFDNPPETSGGMTRLKLRWGIVRLVKSKTFFYFGGFLVLFDLVFMCLRSFYASEQTLELVDNAETAFTLVFAIEIIIRMAGTTSWMNFWSTKRNLFDLFLVISTCVIQLPMIQDSWVYKYLTIFQILRMYRLFICIPRVRRLLVSFKNIEMMTKGEEGLNLGFHSRLLWVQVKVSFMSWYFLFWQLLYVPQYSCKCLVVILIQL
jgi:hypothetical protein